MADTIKIEALGDAIQDELAKYHRHVTDRVNVESEETAKALVKKTKATAPKRKKGGAYRRAIGYEERTNALGVKTFVWGAKGKHARLTHLLVHGHAKANGGRVDGDPFLHNALDELAPEYERKVQEAITNDQ